MECFIWFVLAFDFVGVAQLVSSFSGLAVATIAIATFIRTGRIAKASAVTVQKLDEAVETRTEQGKVLDAIAVTAVATHEVAVHSDEQVTTMNKKSLANLGDDDETRRIETLIKEGGSPTQDDREHMESAAEHGAQVKRDRAGDVSLGDAPEASEGVT